MVQFIFAGHDFLYLYTHIRFIVNKPDFHFKGESRISKDGVNKINLSIIAIYYTKISKNKVALLFYRWKQNEKHHVEIVKDQY